MVKYSKKPGYRPTLKIKMPIYDDKPGFNVFNKDKETVSTILDDDTIDLSMFTAGSEAIHLLEFTGLWQTNNKFGGTWRLIQTKMYTSPGQLAGYMMDEDSDDETVSDKPEVDDEDVF